MYKLGEENNTQRQQAARVALRALVVAVPVAVVVVVEALLLKHAREAELLFFCFFVGEGA